MDEHIEIKKVYKTTRSKPKPKPKPKKDKEEEKKEVIKINKDHFILKFD